MNRINWRDYIVIDPEIHHGDPCIKGTRIPVSTIIGSLANGMPVDDVLSTFPQLTSNDIQAALAYAAEVMRHELLLPFA